MPLFAALSAGGRWALSVAQRHPFLILLVLAVAYAWHQHGRAERWEAHSAIEASNHRRTKEAYHTAQLAAEASAQAARLETERRYAELAEEADNANDEADHWRAAARLYADAGGLHGQTRAGADREASGSGTSAEDHLAQSSDRSSPNAVILSRSDFDTLTGNTERLIRVRAWGERLIRDGFARSQ